VEKANLSKGYHNPKKKIEGKHDFSEITEDKIGKKLPCILCILTIFLELCLLDYL